MFLRKFQFKNFSVFNSLKEFIAKNSAPKADVFSTNIDPDKIKVEYEDDKETDIIKNTSQKFISKLD
jgi:hypothetical protein